MVHRRPVRHGSEAESLLVDLLAGVQGLLLRERVEGSSIDWGACTTRTWSCAPHGCNHLGPLREVAREALAVDHAGDGHRGLGISPPFRPP